MPTDLLIAIVSAKPDSLDQLSAQTYRYMDHLVDWAKATGYETWLFSDEGGDLHGDDIKSAIKAYNGGTSASPATSGLYDRRRILVYFCGHGFSKGDAQVWALTRGRTHYEDRIDVVGMVSVLQQYQPNHISVFSDACAQAAYLDGGTSPVFPSPDNVPPPENTPLDRFFASSKGASSYSNKEGPVFSQLVGQVLLDSPVPDAALDEMYRAYAGVDAVTNQSLRAFIKPRFESWIDNLNKRSAPLLDPSVSPPDHIYRVVGPSDPKDTDSHPPPTDPLKEETESTRDAECAIDSFRDDIESLAGNLPDIASRTVVLTDETARYGAIIRGSKTSIPVSPRAPRPRSLLIGFGWEDRDSDAYNGSAIIRMNGRSFIIPEFKGYTTLVSAGRDSRKELVVGIGAVKNLRDPESGLQTYGGTLLNRITSMGNDPNVLQIIANYAKARIHEDPLVPLALSYFYDAIAQRRAIAGLIEELAAQEGQVSVDLALLAGLTIDYDPEQRALTCEGYPLATQLPVLSRGWSQLMAFYKVGIFEEIQPLVTSIGIAPYAVFRDAQDHQRIAHWLETHFAEVPEPEPELVYHSGQ